jgi:hypothetical protein
MSNRVAPNPTDIVELHIDESSQTNHRYLVLGGIVAPLVNALHLSAAIAKARLPELPQGEAKWTKVSRSKLAAYKRIVDVLFHEGSAAHFHCLVVDTTMVDHRRFNAGSREIGFNKEIYQLAMKCARLYPNKLFYVYPDRRVTTQKPEDLRRILNFGCSKKRDKRDWPFRRCQFRESKSTPQIQLTDIIIGGLAYRLNGHERKNGASSAKCELSAYILARAQIVDPLRDTAKEGTFTVWHRQLR